MPATPIHLTLADVKREGLKAYREGRLSAQGPTPRCAYRDPSGLPCIIGASLGDVDATSFAKLSVTYLARQGRLTADDVSAMADLQGAHDQWASSVADGDAEDARKAEARLLALLEAA